MAKIKKLSLHEAQKIAAGEVVERPANVLKELLENALDAQATKITIHIKDGGKESIRVVDNGHGMSSEDAELCFEQHATSKITHVEQLQEIVTYGFRGEALASIAAVSTTTLITKEADSAQGTKIEMHYGSIQEKSSTGAADGSDITIARLFYNLPARKKFLKTRETEWRQIQHLFFAVCLTRLDIDFNCYSEGKLIYNCPRTKDLATRWSQLFDHQSADSMLTCSLTQPGISIHGIASSHHYQRYDRSQIYLFVNNRWVKDSKLTRAVIRGYQNVLPPGRYPAAALFINVDPTQVDINIHPRKEEVQFMHPRKVEQALQQAITCALEQQLSNQLKREVTIKPEAPTPTTSSFSPFNFDVLFTRTAPVSTTAIPSDPFAVGTPQKVSPTTSNATVEATPTQASHPIKEQTQQHAVVIEKNYTLIGQYQLTFLLIEKEDGLLLVDQHAAHERILYERFVAAHGQNAKVQLLFAQTLTFTPAECETIAQHQALFSSYGIDLEPFGTNQIKVQATPVALKNVALEPIIRQAVASIAECKDLGTEQFEKEMQKKLYADMACKAAVKAGDHLSRETMQQLLDDLEQTPHRFSCPHGRPTSWLLRLDDIKKHFKRDYRSYSGVSPE